jgi:glycosyltransferase involved in cell wall biosynthesis
LGLEPDAFVAAWVGRMTPEKGLDVFIDALARLHDLPIHVCAVGDGPERAAQMQRAAALGVGEHIRWPGLLREAARYFLAFDVLVLSSRTEGVPMVVLEAIAAEVPVVATAVGGIPDVVSPNEAMLVASESPDTLAAAIRFVYEDRAAARRRAQEALSRLNRDFAEAPWLRKYELVYEAARERAGRRRRQTK